MELIAIGFLLGIIACIVFVGVGMIYAERMADRTHEHNNNNRVLRDISDADPDPVVGVVDGKKYSRYPVEPVSEEEVIAAAKKLGVKIGGE